MADITADGAVPRRDTAFFGHPPGLGWLSFCEFWERFSYYGMTTLLVLYMTHSLLTPEHLRHVIGFAPFEGFIAGMYGPAAGQALASHIFGFYSAFVYLTPLAGGFIADRFIGRTNAVTLGAILMAIGHFLMAFDATFLLAILCLLTGVGFFKGNIASQVGALYGQGDPRRADAYQVFLFFVQIAVIGSPFICGRLASGLGWHYGFGAAGVGMVIGLITYIAGRRTLPPEPVRRTTEDAPRPPLTKNDKVRLGILIALIPVLAVSIVGNNEFFNAYLIWAERNYDLYPFGFHVVVTDILGYGSIISAATIAISVAFWRWYAKRWHEPDEITKITIGVVISAAAILIPAGASALIAGNGVKVSLGWAVALEFVNDLGFANVLPVGLALYTRAAPKHLTGLIVGIYYLHLFIGNLLVGWLGGFLEKMPAASFWLMHAGLVFGAAVVLFAVKLLAGGLLAPAYDGPVDEVIAETAA